MQWLEPKLTAAFPSGQTISIAIWICVSFFSLRFVVRAIHSRQNVENLQTLAHFGSLFYFSP